MPVKLCMAFKMNVICDWGWVGGGAGFFVLKREHKVGSGSYSGKEKRRQASHSGYLEFCRGHLAILFWP